MNARISVMVTSVLFAAALSPGCSTTRYEAAEYDLPAPEPTRSPEKLSRVSEPAPQEVPALEEESAPDDMPAPEAVPTSKAAPAPAGASAQLEARMDMPHPGLEAGASTGAVRSRAARQRSAGGSRAVNTLSASPPPADTVTTSRPAEGVGGLLADYAGSGSEAYTDYGVNALELTERDRLSTFSIDVDTASYSIARRKLREGQLPPTSAVRVEEFVNSFDYDYTGPTGEAPFAVNMEAAPSPYQPGHHILRVGVQGRAPSADRAPVHLTFLVDTSGSMSSPDKLGLAQQSLHTLVENLRSDDTVALATYAGSVREVLQPTPASEASAIHQAINALSAGGSTAMSSGIDLAYRMASEAQQRGHENRVIVLSDGDANVGPSSHEEILRQIRRYAEEGITLSTIGFGMGNYKDTMMEQLANKGDGNYYYIDSRAEAQEVFGDKLGGTLEVIAKDVKIQVEFDPEVVMAWRLIGYENRDIADRDFRNDRVDAGEIGAGHTVTALYDVILRDGYRQRIEGDGDLAAVRLRSKAPGADSPAVEWETRFPARLVHDELTAASDDFRLAFGAATFAELLRGSPYVAEVSYARVWELVRGAADGRADRLELLELIEAAGRLSGEAWALAER